MIHRQLRSKRIEQSYNDGVLVIGEKQGVYDEYNTLVKGQVSFKELGRYGFRIKGIHNSDRVSFGNETTVLSHQVVIKLNHFIHAGLFVRINNDTYDIIKVYQNTKKDETELLLGKDGGYVAKETSF